MHASIEQLLNASEPHDAAAEDGSELAGPSAQEHLAACSDCQRELRRIEGLRAEMKSLPEVGLSPEAADAVWTSVLARSGERTMANKPVQRAAQWWPLGLAASVLVAALAVLLAPWQGAELPIAVSNGEPVNEEPLSEDRLRTVPETSQLVARSQQLEQLLGTLNYEPRVVNARTAGTIARLEDQIAWIDYGLGEGSDGQLSESDANALWRQRVELMNSLVHVRYAQAQRVDF